MAQGNMLLGMARGSVGDVTFARSVRKQVSRARNRKPNNPRTLAQIRQRIFMKTSSLAYGVLAKDFADQTFEGAKDARENQQRFTKINIKLLKEIVNEAKAQYASKDDVFCPVNNYQVAEGTLNSRAVRPIGQGRYFFYGLNGSYIMPSSTTTWRQFAEMIGIPAGSQLTFIQTNGDSSNNWKITQVARSRVILSPSDGNLDKAMFDASFNLVDPNPSNEGSVVFGNIDDNFGVTVGGINNCCAVVVSHYDKKWRYSSASLYVTGNYGNNFADAVSSWEKASTGSDEYTRQAE